MDPINPWLDPSEVRHLAEQLLRPVAPARLSAADPEFNPSFEGFIKPDHPSSSNLPPKGQTIEETEPEKPLQDKAVPAHKEVPAFESVEEITAPAPTSENLEATQNPESTSPPPPPAAPSKTRFLERIRIFRDWLAKNFNATDIFILDREGKVVFDESGHGRLHFMARNLAPTPRGSGNIHVKIGPSAILEVVPCETPYGRIVLGTLVPESLPADHLRTIVEVLKQTASPA